MSAVYLYGNHNFLYIIFNKSIFSFETLQHKVRFDHGTECPFNLLCPTHLQFRPIFCLVRDRCRSMRFEVWKQICTWRATSLFSQLKLNCFSFFTIHFYTFSNHIFGNYGLKSTNKWSSILCTLQAEFKSVFRDIVASLRHIDRNVFSN